MKSQNSANPNVLSKDDAPVEVKINNIGRYFSNTIHIKQFNKDFRAKMNSLLFSYINEDGITLGVYNDTDFNKAIKLFKNTLATNLITYLK
ncbi:MAG: hypothetical protein Nk1A_7990 [Endomicrobiia bacterium]|nr:MAG: hypothetical protein Nk1A_7990 [Endomicrobiia bacterium]